MKHSKKLVTLSVLTTMSGAAIYFLNKTLDTAAVRKNLLASAEKEIFSWQFGDIFYTKKGTGTPMLLLHDLHCASSGREWQYIEDTLAKDHTVYTLDLLGCGRSDKPAITYTNFLYVQLIVTLHQAGHRMSNRRNCIRFIRFFRRNRLQYSPEMLRPNHDDQPDRPCQAQQNSG